MKRSTQQAITTYIALILALAFSASAPFAATESPPDLRVLIDMSGSMKENDPQNLRQPALRLLAHLLPNKAKAGVWTFGQYVNMLVPHDEINDQWRTQAITASTKINSLGLFTDIEASLAKSTWDLKPMQNSNVTILLLTDGLVDIHPNSAINQESKNEILKTILPTIQSSQAKIISIALSDHADELLLQQLAATTNGWFEKVNTADDLERIFLRMFEKATNPDTLPITDNVILVDNSITELTLLIFRTSDAKPTKIVTPHDVTFSNQKLPPNVSWHQEGNYDLITIDQPMEGSWHIDAETDPDNRAMIVTDLKVEATVIPNNVNSNDTLNFNVHLTQNDNVIEKKEFLHFVKANATQSHKKGQNWDWLLLDNGRGDDITPADGHYNLNLQETLLPGTHTLTVEIDGTTFKRVTQQTFNVYDSPVIARISDEIAHGGKRILHVIPRSGLIDPGSLHATATINSEREEHSYTLQQFSPNEWRLDLTSYDGDQQYNISTHIRGKKPNGEAIDITLTPQVFGTTTNTALNNEETHEAPESPANVEPETTKTPEEQTPTRVDIETGSSVTLDTKEEYHWVSIILQTLIINLILGVGIFYAYKKWIKNTIAPPKAAQHD